jgi:hypothetical protein
MSRSVDPADRTRASVAFEPTDPAFTRAGQLVGTRVAERPSFSSRSLIFSIVNQQVRLAGMHHYRPGCHVCRARRWHPIFASTSTLGWCHIISSQRKIFLKNLWRTYHGVKDDHWCIGGRIHRQAYIGRSVRFIQDDHGQWHMDIIWTLTFGTTHGERQRSLKSGEGKSNAW